MTTYKLYESFAGYPGRGLTDEGVSEAERRGLGVDVDAYGHAFAVDDLTGEVVDLDEQTESRHLMRPE